MYPTRTYQVVVGQVGQLIRLNAQVLEGLGSRVDLLVHELPLHLVGGHGGPPDELVQVVGQGLQGALGDVDVAAVLDDFAVDQLGNLGGRVVLGAVKLIGLTGGRVVVEHELEGSTDVDGLYSVSVAYQKTSRRDLRGRARSAPACGWR